MQDRYSGDVGDFGKFGLLRHILNGSQLKLGINWYLFPNEDHNEDGRFINYLSIYPSQILSVVTENYIKRCRKLFHKTDLLGYLRELGCLTSLLFFFQSLLIFIHPFLETGKRIKKNAWNYANNGKQKLLIPFLGLTQYF
jgi:hypothetical protein